MWILPNDSKRIMCCLAISVCSVACSPSGVEVPNIPGDSTGGGIDDGGSNDGSTRTEDFESLSWETASHPERAEWSSFLYKEIDLNGSALLSSEVTDVGLFCPNFSLLNRQQKINFWAMLLSAMSKYESGWDPTTRYVETTMGTDAVTGSQVTSEGLLQLSYQDVEGWPFCNEFNWDIDKNLAPRDPKKTILDPFKNLRCGMKILNQQIADYKKLTIKSGAYWAVLIAGGSNQQIIEIGNLTKSLSFCQ